MVEFFLSLAEYLDKILWGPWTMIFIAGVSVYLTARSGLFQIRGFAFILRNTLGRLFGKKSGEASTHRMTQTWRSATRPSDESLPMQILPAIDLRDGKCVLKQAAQIAAKRVGLLGVAIRFLSAGRHHRRRPAGWAALAPVHRLKVRRG